MASAKHRTFRKILAHTAKCEKCGYHNTSILYRCVDCAFPICTPCWSAEGGTGKHRNVAITEPPVILPPLASTQTKKKDMPTKKALRPRKNVVVSDSDETDEEMPDVPAEIDRPKNPIATIDTDHAAASLTEGNKKEYSEDVLRAADLLLGFFNAADTSTTVGSPSSCSNEVGMAAILDAAQTVQKWPVSSPNHQRPSVSFTSDSPVHPQNLNQQRIDSQSQVSASGQEYDYSLASTFTPINPRKDNPSARALEHNDLNCPSRQTETQRKTERNPIDDRVNGKRNVVIRGATSVINGVRRTTLLDERSDEIDSDIEILSERSVRPSSSTYEGGRASWDESEPESIEFMTFSKTDSAQDGATADDKVPPEETINNLPEARLPQRPINFYNSDTMNAKPA